MMLWCTIGANMNNTKTFYNVLINALIANTTNTVMWFAVTFWVYLETKSVLTTSVMAGVYVVTVALSGLFLGTIVDHTKKKHAMFISSIGSLVCYLLAFGIYIAQDEATLARVENPALWFFIILALLGAIAGNLRGIALSTTVTILFPEEKRDKANGLVGSGNGLSFLLASVISGVVIGFFGMHALLLATVLITLGIMAHLFFIRIPEKDIVHTHEHENVGKVDLRGTLRTVMLVPGLIGLIFFHAFNNFLGGVFMALMDAYGLELMPVQMWGFLLGVMSVGFILGGIAVAKWGLGKNPLFTFCVASIAMWIACIFFTIQASIILLALGMLIWMCLSPIIEAAEQTILQKTVPLQRQGRVFGFAQSVEQAASPITAFLVGPLAQFVFIPFMTTGAGVALIGDWFGVGTNRGIALIFILAGFIGLIATLLMMRSQSYARLSKIYNQTKDADDVQKTEIPA